jgi:hypothetical protein
LRLNPDSFTTTIFPLNRDASTTTASCVSTPKALANVSPGLALQPWVKKEIDTNAESVGEAQKRKLICSQTSIKISSFRP